MPGRPEIKQPEQQYLPIAQVGENSPLQPPRILINTTPAPEQHDPLPDSAERPISPESIGFSRLVKRTVIATPMSAVNRLRRGSERLVERRRGSGRSRSRLYSNCRERHSTDKQCQECGLLVIPQLKLPMLRLNRLPLKSSGF